VATRIHFIGHASFGRFRPNVAPGRLPGIRSFTTVASADPRQRVADKSSTMRRGDEARFGFAVGPHSWKQFLFPPRLRLWQAARRNGGMEITEPERDERPLALVGVRACELHGIGVQDRVLLEGGYVDGDYAARRRDAFVVAVNCFEPGGTCFCVSMGTGPRADAGYDLALTEILDDRTAAVDEAATAGRLWPRHHRLNSPSPLRRRRSASPPADAKHATPGRSASTPSPAPRSPHDPASSPCSTHSASARFRYSVISRRVVESLSPGKFCGTARSARTGRDHALPCFPPVAPVRSFA
jgi:hypothetical protein